MYLVDFMVTGDEIYVSVDDSKPILVEYGAVYDINGVRVYGPSPTGLKKFIRVSAVGKIMEEPDEVAGH